MSTERELADLKKQVDDLRDLLTAANVKIERQKETFSAHVETKHYLLSESVADLAKNKVADLKERLVAEEKKSKEIEADVEKYKDR